MYPSRNQDTIQLLKSDDCGTEKLDSISFPLCSDYTFIRRPVSLPVQLEIVRIHEFKLAKSCRVIRYHLPFYRSCLVESLLNFRFFFHSWDPLSTDHISIGSITALPHKLNARIFHTYTPAFQCLSIRVYKIQGIQPDTNIQICCAHFMCENEKRLGREY